MLLDWVGFRTIKGNKSKVAEDEDEIRKQFEKALRQYHPVIANIEHKKNDSKKNKKPRKNRKYTKGMISKKTKPKKFNRKKKSKKVKGGRDSKKNMKKRIGYMSTIAKQNRQVWTQLQGNNFYTSYRCKKS